MRMVETISEVIEVAKFLHPQIQVYGLRESLEGYFKKEIETIGTSTVSEIMENPFEFQSFFWVEDKKGVIELKLRTIAVKESFDDDCENYLYFYAIN
jgi:hypothetical protein